MRIAPAASVCSSFGKQAVESAWQPELLVRAPLQPLTRQLELILGQGVLPVQDVVPQRSAAPRLQGGMSKWGVAGEEAGGGPGRMWGAVSAVAGAPCEEGSLAGEARRRAQIASKHRTAWLFPSPWAQCRSVQWVNAGPETACEAWLHRRRNRWECTHPAALAPGALEAHSLDLKVAYVLGTARVAALSEAVAVQLCDAFARDAGPQVQAVHVLADCRRGWGEQGRGLCSWILGPGRTSSSRGFIPQAWNHPPCCRDHLQPTRAGHGRRAEEALSSPQAPTPRGPKPPLTQVVQLAGAHERQQHLVRQRGLGVGEGHLGARQRLACRGNGGGGAAFAELGLRARERALLVLIT